MAKEESDKPAGDSAGSSQPPDYVYWLKKTPEERFEALEAMRQAKYGYDPATARVERVLTIVPLDSL